MEAQGHKFVMRKRNTQPLIAHEGKSLTQWQIDICQKNNLDAEKCGVWERENNNWEKEQMMTDYLNKDGVTHVLIADMDILLLHPEHDTMKIMAEMLERTKKDIIVADEDWRTDGRGHLNGGLIFAKSTNFSRTFFANIVRSHTEGPAYLGVGPRCAKNEQLCLQAALDAYPGLSDHLLVASGSRFNRHPCGWTGKCGPHPANPQLLHLPANDTDLEIVHFMGGSKGGAMRYLNSLEKGAPVTLMQKRAV